jgi:hypothetical protein
MALQNQLSNIKTESEINFQRLGWKKIFVENLKIHKKILKLTNKIFSHYIINQLCLNNCDQCKNPEQIQQ